MHQVTAFHPPPSTRNCLPGLAEAQRHQAIHRCPVQAAPRSPTISDPSCNVYTVVVSRVPLYTCALPPRLSHVSMHSALSALPSH